MSEALTQPAAKVIALPTASPAKVRQPEYHARYKARRQCFRDGSVTYAKAMQASAERRREAVTTLQGFEQ